MHRYVKCSLRSCGYGWNIRGATFCAKCGKALVGMAPPPPWQSGAGSAESGKGGKPEQGNAKGGKSEGKGKDGGKGGKPFLKGERWNRRAKRDAERSAAAGGPSAASLVESLAAVPGMQDCDLSQLRQKVAALKDAQGAVQKPQPSQRELEALEVLKGSTFFGAESALATLSGKAVKATAHQPGARTLKDLPLAELEKRIAHKEGTLGKAKGHVEQCKLRMAEVQKEVAKAEEEAAARASELEALQEAKRARTEQEQHEVLLRSLVGSDAAASVGLPDILAADEHLRREMEQLQSRAQDLFKQAAAKAVAARTPPSADIVVVSPLAGDLGDFDMVDDKDIEDLFEAGLETQQAKRARVCALVAKYGGAAKRPVEPAARRRAPSPAPGGRGGRERSRSGGRARPAEEEPAPGKDAVVTASNSAASARAEGDPKCG